MHRTIIAVTIMILMNIITLPTTTLNAQTSGTPIKWVKYINPTNIIDFAFGTCVFRGYIAVVGIADHYPYIVLLDRDSGDIVREWIGGEIGGFYNCVSIGDKLYVVGTLSPRGVIYVFDENLNIVKTANSINNYTGYKSIIYDGSYIYIGGESSKDVNNDGNIEYIWLIEKRTVDLNLVSFKEIYLDSWKGGFLLDMDVNPVTGDIWVVGRYYVYVNRTEIGHSLIAILNNNLNSVKLIDYPVGHENYLDWPYGICFDSNGYAYVTGLGVAKFDLHGKLVAINRKLDYSRKILCIGNSIYVFRHPFLTVLDNNLNIVDEYVLSRNVDANVTSSFMEGKASFDGKNIYVAGVDRALGWYNLRIVVYSIAIVQSPPPLPPDFIVTTSLAPINITTTFPITTTALVASTTTAPTISKSITKTIIANTTIKPSVTSIIVLTTSTISPTTTISLAITPTTTIATTQLAPPPIQNPIFSPILIALPITVIAIPFITYRIINYKKKRDEERIRRRIEKIIRDIDELLNR